MTKTNIVGINNHPKFRSVVALRDYLDNGQEPFGTKVSMDAFTNAKSPEEKAMLDELNAWCESIKGNSFNHYQVSTSNTTRFSAVQLEGSDNADPSA